MKANSNGMGLVLFAIYVLLYGGFVFATAFFPATMRWKPVGDVNLAVVYGVGLILVAFVLALVYGIFGGSTHDSQDKERGQ